MKRKKQMEMFLFGFAIGAILFTTTLSYCMGILNRHYNQKIEILENKQKSWKEKLQQS